MELLTQEEKKDSVLILPLSDLQPNDEGKRFIRVNWSAEAYINDKPQLNQKRTGRKTDEVFELSWDDLPINRKLLPLCYLESELIDLLDESMRKYTNEHREKAQEDIKIKNKKVNKQEMLEKLRAKQKQRGL